MVRRQAPSRLIESLERGNIVWTWVDARKRPVSVMVVLDRKTPQQITLSVRPVPLTRG
ncbi:MAG: hypothetical protein WDN24_00830 [Sphingomonas sp.]